MSPRTFVRASVAIVAAAVLMAGCGSAEGAARLSGMVRTPTPTIEIPADVTDDLGEPVRFTAPAGGLALVYFGYTSCPDVCPTTLADLRAAIKDLGGAADRLAITFVTVDPERDTDDVLDGYVHSFFERAAGVRVPDREALARLAEPFGATFGRTEAADGSIEISHSAFLYALDPDQHLLVQWPFGTTRDELTSDLALLLDRQEQR